MRRALKVLVVVAAILAAILYLDRPRTPPFKDAPNSVASLERVRLGGYEQWILIRGRDRSKPILLFLHGGPGMPLMPLAHLFQGELERDFVVVHWDQRGAGKSYSPHTPSDSMNVAQILADTRELTELLCRRFQQQKVYLVGHSWGTFLGLFAAQQSPELFHAVISVGQGTMQNNRAPALREGFVLERARDAGKLDQVRRDLAQGGWNAREKWLVKFGGELHSAGSRWPLLVARFRSPEYTLFDCWKAAQGERFCIRHLKDSIPARFTEQVTSLKVPIYFFLGRHDYRAPSELAAEYFEKLEAPRKKLVWFENSAHYPFLEEPIRFAEEMRIAVAESQTHQP